MKIHLKRFPTSRYTTLASGHICPPEHAALQPYPPEAKGVHYVRFQRIFNIWKLRIRFAVAKLHRNRYEWDNAVLLDWQLT